MRLNQIVSHKPHNCINLDKYSNQHHNARQVHRMMVWYLTDMIGKMDDIEDIWNDARDRDYQVEIEYSGHNVPDREIDNVIGRYKLENPFNIVEHDISMTEYRSLAMMGLDPGASRIRREWTHEKSFICESVSVRITNKHEFTFIEKEFADEKIAEYTKDAFNFTLVTTKKMKEYDVVIDEEIEEIIDRCNYLLESDYVDIRGWSSKRVDIIFNKYRETTLSL